MPTPAMPGAANLGLVKRSLSLSGHRTSVALEPEFWSALAAEAAARRVSLASLVAAVDAARGPDTPLASALRVHALRHARSGAARTD
jgi:predicted DNA-binding ribbon-helix-helix protein